MANSTTGHFGLRPVRYVDGSPYNGATIRCYKAASYATALYVGDAVMISNELDDCDPLGKYISIEKATITDGGQILGVIVGFEPTTSSSLTYSPASTQCYVNVCMAQDIVFQIKGCGGGTPIAGWVTRNARMTAGTASTITGLSGDKLDEGTGTAPTTDASNPLVILGISDLPDNELGDYAIWDVLINSPQFFNLGGATAVGRYLAVTAT